MSGEKLGARVLTPGGLEQICVLIREGATLDTAARDVFDVSGQTIRRRAREDAALAESLQAALAERVARSQVRHAHGTMRRYIMGCRCEPCTEANRRHCARSRLNRHRKALPEGISHGASTYSNWGCRCAVCSVAHSAKCAAYKRSRSAAPNHYVRGDR